MISIIMSVYNEKKEWLKEAIESILYQTFNDFEFIITLDNPDNIELREIIEYYKKMDKRIQFIINNENKGLVWSLNNMLKIAKGDYIARMDADDISLSTRLEKQVKYIVENNIDLLGTNTIVFDENSEYINTVMENDSDIKSFIGNGSFIPHPTWLVKKSVYEKLNGYRYICFAEDYDFILRAIKSNFKLGNVKEPLLKYRININSVSRNNSLKQKLTSIYLFDNYDRIEKISQKEINGYLKNIDTEKEKRYSLGEKYYYRYKSENNIIEKIYILILLVFKYNIYLKYNKLRNLKIKLRRKK